MLGLVTLASYNVSLTVKAAVVGMQFDLDIFHGISSLILNTLLKKEYIYI